MQRHATIGFAGHVDHGKTTLVKCLTGVDTDRKREEKRRGMSIEAGVAPLVLPSGQRAAVIDVPGHTDFLKNTIRGLHGVDVGILVVAADDGVMPQTREHLEILKFCNASAGFVVLSKIDLVDAETMAMAELEIAELVAGCFLEGQPLYRFSANFPELSAPLLEGLDAALRALPAKQPNAPFRLWIDQVRRLTGHGTVVSGTVDSGTIGCNQTIELLPSGEKTRGRTIESHAMSIPEATAGQRVGINLHRIPLERVHRGMCLVTPGAIAAGYMLNMQIQMLKSAGIGIRNRQRVKVYLGTSLVAGMVVLMGAQQVGPGESALAQLRLLRPVAAVPGDPVVITPMNLNAVIAGGRVLEVSSEKYRQAKSQKIRPGLEALSKADVDAYTAHVFASTQDRFLTARELSARTGLPAISFERRISSAVQKGVLLYVKGKGAVRTAHASKLKQAVLAVVSETFKTDPLKNTVALSEVAAGLKIPVETELLQWITATLCREKRLLRYQGGFRLPDDEALLDAHRQELSDRLLAYARQSALLPFSADTFWKAHRDRYRKEEVRQLLNYLHSRRKLARLNDRRFLSLDAVAEIQHRVAQFIAQKGFVAVNDCKALFGYGRWGGTHVLDYLDSIGFTVRRDNRHYLKVSSAP
jgi:selenocysteine-specific elongation factor